MNIDVYDENEYLKYKEVVESGKNSRRYRIISKENEYIESHKKKEKTSEEKQKENDEQEIG